MNYKHGCTELSKRTKGNPQWRAHVSWLAMRARCTNEEQADFPNYGGRGIVVCGRWDEFANFYEDMGPPPPGTSIDRIDNEGNYEPGNCRWADRKTQNANKRNRRVLSLAGTSKSVSEWAEHLGVPRRLLQVRMDRGWPVERILNPTRIDTRFKSA